MNENLNDQFLYELFKLCFNKKEVVEVCKVHLKYKYLPSQEFKKVWKTILNYYDAKGSKLPTYGYVAQTHDNDSGVDEIIAEIKNAPRSEMEDVIDRLEEFVKRSMFLDTYDSLADVYNRGDKDKAYTMLKEVGEEIVDFSIRKGTGYYDLIFEEFEQRHHDRRIRSRQDQAEKTMKVPFGIDELDDITHGGIDVGDTFLALAQSGVGKTKLLRWMGVSAARRGYNVLHIQAEGTREECLDGYDATWTGVTMRNLKEANIPQSTYEKIMKACTNIQNRGGEIFVHAYEKFNQPTILEVRDLLYNLIESYGEIHLVLMDYFELFHPGDDKNYSVDQERHRRRAIGRMLKDLAIEAKTRIATATQASDVHPDLLNDPEYVMTRHNVSEFKNVAEPFSYFITLNQTVDEKKEGMMRLYCDKMRNYKSKQTIQIFQNYDTDRFYNRKKTLEEIYIK